MFSRIPHTFRSNLTHKVTAVSQCSFTMGSRFMSHLSAQPDIPERIQEIMDTFQVLSLSPDTSVLNYVKSNFSEMNGNNSFHTMDLGSIEHRFAQWRHYLPRADPHYALKCNNDEVLAATLFAHGAGFDCASKAEIKQCLDMGVSPSRIVFANPAKLPSDVEYAATVGVTKMTFDSEDELYKMNNAFQRAGVTIKPQPILRIITDDSHSVCRFSAKFGAPLEDAEHLLAVARSIDLDVVGVSFHVGSGCASTYSYKKAIQDARSVFELGYTMDHPMHVLDLGGGFPANDHARIPFSEITAAIRDSLDTHFPVNLLDDKYVASGPIPPLSVIAEPGRYFAADTMMYASPVISRRLNHSLPSWHTTKGEENNEPHILYYVSDGVYGAFNGILYDHYIPSPPLALFNDPMKQAEHEDNIAEYVNSSESDSDTEVLHNPQPNENDSDAENGMSQGFLKKHKYVKGTYRVKIFGPTCDGLDCIFQEVPLPQLDVGDFILFPEMGAYSVAAQSSFNGIVRPPVKYFRSDKSAFSYDFPLIE